MTIRALALLAPLLALGTTQIGTAQLTPYSQDFEALVQADSFALGNDGWIVWGNIDDTGGNNCYRYGTFPAPNLVSAFCDVTLGEGGAPQGAQQLVVYSDYQNSDHAIGKLVESNLYREQVVAAGDVGQTAKFSFDAKRGNITAPSTAMAFIKTVDPLSGYTLSNFVMQPTTTTPLGWTRYTIQLNIDASLIGQLLQFGFLSVATNYDSAAVFYDNVDFSIAPTAECMLLLGTDPSDQRIPFSPSDHLLVGAVIGSWEVLIPTVPVFNIPGNAGLSGLDLYFQVLMFNPAEFPNDPLQMSNGLKVTIGGTSHRFGQGSGLDLWAPMDARLGQPFQPAFRIAR